MAFNIFGKKDDNQELLDRIAMELEGNPSWQVGGVGKRLCPYCGAAAAREKSPDLPQALFRHLQRCAKWKDGQGEQLSQTTLETMALSRLVRRNLVKMGPWSVLDHARHWLCPYCAQVTDVRFPDDNKITSATLAEITEHLKGCRDFRPGRASKEEAYLKQIAAKRKRHYFLKKNLRQQIPGDKSLRYTDSRGRWICPWCKIPISSVDVSSEFALRNSAPPAIATHLLEACGAFSAKEPKASTAELDALFLGAAKKAAAPKKSDTVYMHAVMLEELKQEIDSMREAVVSQKEANDSTREMEKSLEIARQRQLKMLPSIPEIPGLSIDVWYAPCASVSGDFYDFIRISDTSYGVLIGDVSGHGIEAALVMSMSKKALQMYGLKEPDPVKTLVRANADLFGELEKGTFLTVFYAIFDMETKSVRCCRAGHNPPLLANPSRDPVLTEIRPPGIGIGLNSGPLFAKVIKEEVIALQPGDTIVIYTDGITEAMNKKSEEYGFDRFKEVIRRFADHDPKYLIHLVRGDIDSFCAGHPAEDDMMMICMRVTP